jgi:Uncharacterized protein conserved in bacteria (DUF2125)
MTERSSERALLAILALESDETQPSEPPLPAFDTRIQMYLRAMGEENSKGDDPAAARALILQKIAEELAEQPEPHDRAHQTQFADIQTSPPAVARRVQPRRLRFAPLRNSALQRFGAFAAAVAALLMVGWSSAWFYALQSFNSTFSNWRAWEEQSGRQYACASESFGGFHFRVEMTCGSPTATITTENGKFTAEAKALRIAVDLFHPNVIVSKLECPITFAEAGTADSLFGQWREAEAIVTGPKPTPDGISIALADFKVDRVSGSNTVPLAAAEKIAFQAELDTVATAATQKAAYDLTSDITAAVLPSGPPIAARRFEARFKAVLHGAGDMIQNRSRSV